MTDTATPPQPAPVVREWATDKSGVAIAPLKDLTIRELVTEHNAAIRHLRAEVEGLEKLVYVPGLWRCAKCNQAIDRAEAAESRAAKLLAWMERWGHRPDCEADEWPSGEHEAEHCTCGLSEALAAAKGETV